ncbi:uncharacterized protein LOC115014881 isoform X1 [Cottoperca gobio]|uniref:Uncharacterized protein LOC115014881 isoform X1 n=1 Tax=Cottoperca gobio TaxID=56716 RepID=A0A6J2QJQ3_COTGO|nr:uncharacterized protein LOC115014881 isoform X1 [Cottoperca gobio]
MGTLMVAFSTAAFSNLLFPAVSLLSVGDIVFVITNMQKTCSAHVAPPSSLSTTGPLTLPQHSSLSSSCYARLASLSAPPSCSCPPAASFTCSGLSSCFPETTFPTRCLKTTHTGRNLQETIVDKNLSSGPVKKTGLLPLIFTLTYLNYRKSSFTQSL